MVKIFTVSAILPFFTKTATKKSSSTKYGKWILFSLFLLFSNISFGNTFFENIYENLKKEIFQELETIARIENLILGTEEQLFYSDRSNHSPLLAAAANVNTNMMGCSDLLTNLNAIGTVPDPTIAYVDTNPPFGCGSETMYPSPLVSAEQSGSFATAFCVPTPPPYRGLDESFQVVIGGDLIIPSTGGAEIEGRAAIGGNIQVDRSPYGIAESGGGTYVIGAAGDAVGVGGAVSGAGALSLGANNVGQTYNIVSGGTNTATLNNGTKVQNSSSLPLDVTAFMAEVTCLSNDLSNATPTGSFNTSNEFFQGSNNLTLEIITVDGADLNPSTAFNSGYYDIDFGATLVVNISGTTVDLNYTVRAGRVDDPTFTAFGGGPLIYNVIWNFYEATDITLHTNFQGTLIAPLANVDVVGNFNGRIYIGGNLTHSGSGTEIHNYPFTGNLSSFCTSCSTCINPTASIFAIQPSCNNGVAGNDGYLQLSAVTDGDRLAFSTGNTFSGDADYANATPIPLGALPFQFNTGLSNADAGDFTVRVFNGASDCFTDVVVTLNTQDCTVGCDCEEYVYLNDVSIDAVHKFRVASNGVLTEIGSPWVPNGTINNPHGLAVDLNGNLVIGQADNFNNNVPNGPVFKLDCDGNILETDLLNPVVEYGYNFFSKNGILQ